MITRCDHCGSTFEVSDELINSTDPGVRCGECMSLFDARANLYNEAEFLRSAAILKPVQKNHAAARYAETVDSASLETADTVAVEHIYTAAGVVASTSGGNASSKASSIEQDFGARPDVSPDHSSNREWQHPDGNRYPQDIEFERTIATESAQVNINADAGYRDSRRPPSGYQADYAGNYPAETADHNNSLPKDVSGDATTTEKEARRKQQLMREREQRALQMEPERDYQSLPGSEQYQPRADQSHVEKRRIHNESNRGHQSDIDRTRVEPRYIDPGYIDDRDLADDVEISARGDHPFIPDDVLKKSAVHRDNGRRGENLQFRADTPRFATSPSGNNTGHESRLKVRERQVRQVSVDGKLPGGAVRKETRYADNARLVNEVKHADETSRTDNATYADSVRRAAEASRTDAAIAGTAVGPEAGNRETRDSPGERDSRPAPESRSNPEHAGNLSTSEFKHLYDQDVDDLAVRDNKLEVAGSSAQEMRRYQHYRPAVDVAVAEDVTDEPVKRARGGLGIKSLIWFVGLCAAICLLLFAARNVIATMNLPEPVISSFCQVTGCVPAEAKKDVSQLQLMRKTLFPHPEIDGALVISVDVVNGSVYKQPYPTLAVTLLDAVGETIAERAFENTDYEVVDNGETGFLMPGEPTRLKVEIIDTGLNAEVLELVFE